jgi:uncharacterized protein (DUF58 family)
VTTTGVARRTFPLVPRRRLTGLPFGDLPSRRRGHGGDIIGARAYQPGDPITSIDWFASARASSASGSDEFIVRQHAADEAPRVVIVADRRPAMQLYAEPLPWLAKNVALREATAAIAASAAAARADLAALDFGGGEPNWLPPARHRQPLLDDEEFRAPEDTLDRAFTFLGEHRATLPVATFVFVLSDFLAPPEPSTWHDAIARGWDIVPVVIQDPLWERSFPDVGGVAVPVADPRDGAVHLVRLSAGQARRRRAANEERRRELLGELESFGLEVVEITDSDPAAVDGAFIAWAENRRRQRWAR